MSRPGLLLLHGWGFDRTIWDPVCAVLPELAATRWDRGYFGAPAATPWAMPIVAVGHSLGAMLLAQQLPEHVPLVAINGFDRFVGEGAVPRQLIGRMQRRFAQAPAQVLTDFRARCGAAPASATLATAALAADLSLLASHAVPRDRRKVLVLQGDDDPILPERMREEAFAGAPRASRPGAGHLLPITHADWCAQHIRAFACA